MRKLHNPQLRICLLLMLCVLTGGCSPIGEEQSSQTSEPQENSHESVTDLSSAPEESETEPIPMAGGELSLTVQNPQTLNPLLTDDEDTAQMLNLIFSLCWTSTSRMRCAPPLAAAGSGRRTTAPSPSPSTRISCGKTENP